MPAIVRFLAFFMTVCLMAGCGTSLKSNPLCTPNTPNTPIDRRLSAQFDCIKEKNPLVVQELFRLPELQDGISEKDLLALNKIGRLYTDYPEAFMAAFDQIYALGKPRIRKYCAPLQAVFWLAAKHADSYLKRVIVDFHMDTLLSSAWSINLDGSGFSQEELSVVAAYTGNAAIRAYVQQALADGETGQAGRLVLNYYHYNKSVYYPQALDIIQKHIATEKWDDFGTVADRLNDPFLLLWWMKKNIVYGWPGRPDMSGWKYFPPQHVLLTKTGECVSQSGFAAVVLKRNGYDAHLMFVNRFQANDHAICYWKENKAFYYIENAWNGYEGVHGPFASKYAIAARVYDHLVKTDGDMTGFNYASFDGVPFNSNWEMFRSGTIVDPN
jgi:hypothetical protein